MEFKRYQHIERIGESKVEGLLDGTCTIFPKLDGANGSIYYRDGEIKAGSRYRELTLKEDNRGFYNSVINAENLLKYFTIHPNHRLYGEWLIPHTLKTYDDIAWRKFYVFDVMADDEYIPFDDYRDSLELYEIEYIPPMAVLNYPTQSELEQLMECNYFLMKEGCGEGIVIKRYDFINSRGDVKWGKMVRSEFKEKHAKSRGRVYVDAKPTIESLICEKYITTALIDKEMAKLEVKYDGWNPKLIPEFLSVMFYTLVNEEIWNILKTFKNPTINFKSLKIEMAKAIKDKRGDVMQRDKK